MAIPIDAMGNSKPRSKSLRDLPVLTDAELADYIEEGTFDDDGVSTSARTALVRLLRRPVSST